MTPDVSVLVAASRGDHPHHALACTWLEYAAKGAAAGSALTLMPKVLASFLCLVTCAKIFRVPTPIGDALGFVEALLAAPGVQLAWWGAEWPRLRQLCADKQLTANDLPDAWLAAATLHLGEHLVCFIGTSSA